MKTSLRRQWHERDGIDILPTAQAGGFLESLRGFPASSRTAWFGFHRSRSSALSTGMNRESHGKDIVCCIDVTVVMDTTFRAGPFTHIKRESVEKMTALETALTGRVPPINLDQGSTIPVGFVFQLGHKLRPSDIAYRFGELLVLDHVFDCQRLNTDRLVFTDQSCRELVQARHGADQRYGHEDALP